MARSRCTSWSAAYSAILVQFLQGGLMKSFGVLLITVTQQCDILVWEYGNAISLMLIVGSFFSKYHSKRENQEGIVFLLILSDIYYVYTVANGESESAQI